MFANKATQSFINGQSFVTGCWQSRIRIFTFHTGDTSNDIHSPGEHSFIGVFNVVLKVVSRFI